MEDLESFYPYYLCEHTQPVTKLFHFIATFNALCLLGTSILGPWQWTNIALGLLQVIYFILVFFKGKVVREGVKINMLRSESIVSMCLNAHCCVEFTLSLLVKS